MVADCKGEGRWEVGDEARRGRGDITRFSTRATLLSRLLGPDGLSVTLQRSFKSYEWRTMMKTTTLEDGVVDKDWNTSVASAIGSSTGDDTISLPLSMFESRNLSVVLDDRGSS